MTAGISGSGKRLLVASIAAVSLAMAPAGQAAASVTVPELSVPPFGTKLAIHPRPGPLRFDHSGRALVAILGCAVGAVDGCPLTTAEARLHGTAGGRRLTLWAPRRILPGRHDRVFVELPVSLLGRPQSGVAIAADFELAGSGLDDASTRRRFTRSLIP